jgi:hypothetical protein
MLQDSKLNPQPRWRIRKFSEKVFHRDGSAIIAAHRLTCLRLLGLRCCLYRYTIPNLVSSSLDHRIAGR